MFVVEQNSAYPELDGRDTEPGTWHCWVRTDGRVAAYLRVLSERDGSRVSRVVTDPASRGAGHAARLVRHALGFAPRPVVVHAQAHLEQWYARFGFAATGPAFLEDGIPHVPMQLR